MTNRKQQSKKNVDNTSAAYRWNVDCCKNIIIIFSRP